MDDVRVDLIADIDAEVAKVPELIVDAFEGAKKIAEAAKALAPVGLTGDYSAGITAQKTKQGARVFASARESAFVEFGVPAHGQPAHFTLRRAAEAVGFKFRKGKR